ncbi:hypothetical protein BGZ49_004463, partial [Haplosporangium sp. Z 27]
MVNKDSGSGSDSDPQPKSDLAEMLQVLRTMNETMGRIEAWMEKIQQTKALENLMREDFSTTIQFGGKHDESVADWIFYMERLLISRGYAKDRYTAHALPFLIGEASYWAEVTVRHKQTETSNQFVDWDWFKEELRSNFGGSRGEYQAVEKIRQLQVGPYSEIGKFYLAAEQFKLHIRSLPHWNNSWKIEEFEKILPRHIFGALYRGIDEDTADFEEVVKEAIRIDELYEE